MENGYNVVWTDNALRELSETYEYLETHFTQREIKKLSIEIHKTLFLISKNPLIYPLADSGIARRAVIKKYNTIFYRIVDRQVQILSFFANRRDPNSLTL